MAMVAKLVASTYILVVWSLKTADSKGYLKEKNMKNSNYYVYQVTPYVLEKGEKA